MIHPLQQKTRQRKLLYAALILGLFTLSLMHRRFVVEPKAYDLQLRETARGEVELTASTLRLMLLGSRGIAVAYLWDQAIHNQKKHEWNELELIVGSITKLQPYFLTPWLFQSWNLSFNVAVECDRTRDKYYYVSRGIDLLAEGERRNRGGERFPGNPELRHNIGNTYLRKIGYSDEKTAMQCLLDMSMIDPLKRDPRKLMPTPGKVDEDQFAILCQNHPRLVRRLREQLNVAKPAEVVRFLEDNRDVPSRYETPDWSLASSATDSNLKRDREQFPVVPSGIRAPDYGRAVDVFRIARAWSEYAIDPMPPEYNHPDQPLKYFDPVKHRLPKMMAIQIFRGYPGRCEMFFAEGLQEGGWYAGEGWMIQGKDWFDDEKKFPLGGILVGTESKYHSGRSWEEAARLQRDYGVKNGLYYAPAEIARLNAEAKLYRDTFKVRPDERKAPLRSEDNRGEMAKSYEAHQKLVWNVHYRQMCNFDNHLNQAEGEAQEITVHARSLLFKAKRKKDEQADEEAISAYAEAWPYWTSAMLRYPRFCDIDFVQESIYESEFDSVRLVGKSERAPAIRAAVLGTAQLGLFPPFPLHKISTVNEYFKFQPHVISRGFLEWIQVPVENSPDLRNGIGIWSAGAATPLPLPGLAVPVAGIDWWLVRSAKRFPVPEGWRHLLLEESVNVGRSRLMLPVRAEP